MDIDMNVMSQTVMRRIFENVSEGIMITDKYKRIKVINPAFEFVTGYRKDEVLGHSPAILQSGEHDAEFYTTMWETLKNDDMWQGEIWNKRKTGDVYPEWLTIMAIRDEAGEITNYCGIFTDLSERKIVEDELEKRTVTDILTNVCNRYAYIERMNTLLEATSTISHSVKHAVFVIDLDRFKQLNDTLGHKVGDQILAGVASRLKQMLKNRDIIARYGGDEFVLTLTNVVSVSEVSRFAEKILYAIEQPMYIDDKEIFVTGTVGISVYPLDGITAEELVHRADKAMTYAKSNGHGGFAFYFEDLKTDSKRVLLLDAELRKAIENRDFELNFQAKVDVKKEKVLGFEALVRWRNDKLGFVSPDEFIPYAEDTGLIIPLSNIIFEKACEAQNYLQKINKSLPIAINVSSLHFQQVDFLDSVQRIFEQHNVSPHNFELEVTERTVMNDSDETVEKLQRLKDMGFKLSIDDFGTGYSSLSYLIKFPLDYLKIDRSFIQHICAQDDKQAIVDAIIQMSHRLNMKVVAEGVEQKEQVALLNDMNCDIIQGYYYSKPLPLNELEQFLVFWDDSIKEV